MTPHDLSFLCRNYYQILKQGVEIMRAKKFIGIIIILFTVVILGSCSKAFVFPDSKDFSLTASIPKGEYKVGEEVEVKAKLKNLTKSRFQIAFGADNSDTDLIDISLRNINQPEELKVVAGFDKLFDLEKKQTILQDRKFKLDKPGKYEVLVYTNFDILETRTNERKSYNLKVNPMIINVK
jgi:hypothetical protein